MSDYSGALLPQHAAMLDASGITPKHANARGYCSVDERTWFRRNGTSIARAGQRVPGLLVPQLRADGSTWGYQYRPDSPRERDGKPVKYETPVGQRNGLDVPPGIGPQLADPSVPLWVTEGVKKADAGALAGLCIVALPGVWSWRGTNDKGGKLAIPDWHDVALDGRRVILAFDGDVARKSAVRNALDALAKYLSSKGSLVEFLHLPDTEDKTGLDDYLVAGGTVEGLWSLVRPQPPEIAVVADEKGDRATKGNAVTSNVADVAHVAHSSERGADVLNDVRSTLLRFVAFPSSTYAVAAALWIAHTYAIDALDSSPRLAALSPEPQSGKTRLLEIVEHLADRPLFTMNTTSAVLARGLDSGTYRTILLDEADTVFGSKAKGDEELRGILNAGHRRGAVYTRMVGEGTTMSVSTFNCFSAVALAGIGNLPDTVMQRSVVLKMRRRAPGEVIAPFRRREHAPGLDELRTRVESWVLTHRQAIGERWPTMPEGVEDRSADVWEPLLAVADHAGGEWPDLARAACLELFSAAQTEDSGSLGVRLLSDLRALWEQDGDPTSMSTEMILTGLHEMDEAPWATLKGEGLNARGLASLLKHYDIRSKDVRTDFGIRKGYARADLWDAWERYAPGHPREGDKGDKGDNAGQGVADALPVADREGDKGNSAVIPIAPTHCTECSTRLHRGRCVRCEVEGRAAR